MKFRKKPVVIEAVQWFKMGDHPVVTEKKTYSDPADIGGRRLIGEYWVKTLEGGHIVTKGDWIIKGVQGEFYPCKPDIFEQTYEPA